MFKFKSPCLLIRVSHLILIQVIFIFLALALVFFYPQGDDSPSHRYSERGRKMVSASQEIFGILGSAPNLSGIHFHKILEINKYINECGFIKGADLIYADSITGEAATIHLGASGDYCADDDQFPWELYSSPPVDLNLRGEFCVAFLTDDGKYINYLISPKNANINHALILTADNIGTVTIRNNQAYLLMVLFLISALVSLLIINLISKGIKGPLNRLIDGFDRTAAGEESYVEESRDKQLGKLTRAFNEMSRSLAKKRRDLANANQELEKINQSLVESESILTALVDYSPNAIIVTDMDDHVLIYNQAAARDFGYDQNDMIGKKIAGLIPIPDGLNGKNGCEIDFPDTQEIICRRRDGGRFPVLLVRTPLGLEEQQPMAMLYFIKNISESKNYQEMILKLDRIATRGKMAQDIAHEINNYLAILQGNIELIPLLLAKNKMDKLGQKLTVMKDAVGKISNFTDGLTRFSDENSEFAKQDVNQLIENLVAFLKPQNKFDNISIKTNLSENLPLVEIDSSQIQHLLVNLTSNAAEALAEAGEDKWIAISTSFDGAIHKIIIKVADGGPGIDGKHVSRLFVRRFSTKRHGTGLGLITCKNIIDNHSGEISYYSGEDSTSVFIIKIPVERPLKEENQAQVIKDSSQPISTQE